MEVIEMPSDINLLRLMSWLSPAFPVGAYTYSHGLEAAVEDNLIRDRRSAEEWIVDLVTRGAGRTDATLLAHAWRAVTNGDESLLAETAETAAALSATSELALETESQGRAFLKAVDAAWPTPALEMLARVHDGPVAYPVAVGVTAAGHELPLTEAAVAYLHAYAGNLISAVVRLVPLGQTDGLRLTRAVEPLLPKVAGAALATPLASVASAGFVADLKSMQHETQRTRLFRS
ncbi:urease accessory protein UreF [Minwuia thermotolerans]|uniref:Urease accessory protein UreF n=2 Tax=Minwuia thermotolerans TaxID=2056226 RepID=A0A2M9G3H8_9PROT|nr:urease accessory protein UreF [Minwuia thermotolerans]